MRGLDWSHERYTRWHTRDTPEWIALSWQARGLFALVIRVVDRAGRLPVGALGLRGVALAIRASWDEAGPPLEELAREGWIVIDGGTLFVPEHVEREERSSSAGRRPSRTMTYEVIERDGFVCAICREEVRPEEIHIDHRVPLSAGGLTEPSNLQVTHARCNLRKGASVS